MSDKIKLTKNERIDALEKEVDTLWAFVTGLMSRMSAVELQQFVAVPYAPPLPEKRVYDTNPHHHTGTPLPDRGKTTSP